MTKLDEKIRQILAQVRDSSDDNQYNNLKLISQAITALKQAFKEYIKEILDNEFEDEKDRGRGAKEHMLSQHYGAMMALETVQTELLKNME